MELKLPADVGRFAAPVLGDADSGGYGAVAVRGNGIQASREGDERNTSRWEKKKSNHFFGLPRF